MMTYSEKLRDPRWQRKRLEVMSAAGFACQKCGADELPLHVHHTFYHKGKDPWEYESRELICLCEICHEEHHEQARELLIILARLDQAFSLRLIGYAKGLAYMLPSFEYPVIEGVENLGVADAWNIRVADAIEATKDGGDIHEKLNRLHGGEDA